MARVVYGSSPIDAEAFPGLLVAFIVALAAPFLSEHYGGPVMLFALLLGMPLFFLTNGSEIVAALGVGNTLTLVGLAILSWGLAYNRLPWDIIPDWIPIIGTLDDALFGNVTMLIGVVLAAFGVYVTNAGEDHPGDQDL